MMCCSSRRIDNQLNIWEGVLKNYWFMGVQLVIIGGQVLIIFVGGEAFSVKPLSGPEWAVGLVLGAISVPLAIVLRLIPDELIMKLIPAFFKQPKRPELIVSNEDEQRRFEWNPALEEIRDQLSFIKKVRGGRLRNLKYKLRHPTEFLPSRSRDPSAPSTPVLQGGGASSRPASPSPSSPSPSPSSDQPRTPRSRRRTHSRSSSAFGPAAAMAGVVAGSIAGWSPIERSHHENHENDSDGFPTRNAHELFDCREGFEVHRDTARNDELIGDYSTKVPPSQNPDLNPFFDHHKRPLEHTSPVNSGRSRRSSRHSPSVHSGDR